MRIIVTGATGFVGQAAIAHLREAGHDVLAATRRVAPCAAPARVVGDIDSHTDWGAHLDGVDCVIHLAARVHVMHDSNGLEAYREVNTRGTQRLAESAARAGVRRFVYLSSAKVVGESSGSSVFSDASPAAPTDPYAASKHEAEIALQQVTAQSGIEVCILRPPLVYGPGVRANFLRLLRWIDRGIPLPFGVVRNARSLVALDNLANAITVCATHPRAAGQTFLVADSEPLSTPELIRRLATALDRPARLVPVPPAALRFAGRLTGKTAEIDRLLGNFRVDSAGIRTALDWQPPVSSDKALALTAAWYREQHPKQ